MPLPFPNAPAATDFLSVSQGQIQANFQALNNVVAGLFDQIGAATPTAATQLALCNLNLGGTPQLYLVRQGSSAAHPISVGSWANPGYAYMTAGNPAGGQFMIKFGTGTIAAGNLFVDIAYPAPNFTQFPYVQVTAWNPNPVPAAPLYPSLIIDNGGAINGRLTLRVKIQVASTVNIPFHFMAIGIV